MLRRFWQWLKKLFQRLFGKKPAPETVKKSPPVKPQFTDADYERFFFQLLAGVNEKSWSQGRVNGFLDGNKIKVADLVIWLQGFGERLLASPATNKELARRLMRLRGFGELGDVGYELGVQLLERLNREGAKSAKERGEGEESEQGNAEFWFNRGCELYKLGDLEGAVASFDKAVEIKPDYYNAWCYRGSALYYLNRHKEQLLSYDKAIEINPDDYNAWIGRGSALYNLGRCEEAIKSLEKVLETNHDNYDAWLYIGISLDELKRYEEARIYYNKVLKSNPDFYKAWYSLGNSLANSGKYEEAIIYYKNALKIKPNCHEALYCYGVALAEMENYEQAIVFLEKSLEIQSGYYYSWNYKGAILCDILQQYNEAILCFNQALNIKPDDHKAWNNRGVALEKLGRYEEAIASYDKALQIKPDDHEAWINRGIAAGNSVSCDLSLSLSSSIARNNPELNKRGYEGRLASYEKGLKHYQKETHSEGWGRLHQAIGNAHYFQGKVYSQPAYWRKAVTSYNEALKTLTVQDFPELHLEVLKDLILVFLSLGETSKAEEIQRRGTDVLRILLDKCESPAKKQQLIYKFAAFQQITVDMAVHSGNWCAALELAEKGKNTCLSWLYADGVGSPKLAEIKKLLNPDSAIIYWHLSNYALHTFILKYNAEPIIINSSISPVKRLDDFEKWVKNWNQQYSDFRKEEKQKDEKLNTFWRDNLPSMLQQLAEILDISTIINIINNSNFPLLVGEDLGVRSIQNLILIPHRDLHRFPLHALFPDDFTITYLPSAQVGLSLKLLHPNPINQIHQLPLLSVGYPDSKDLDILPQSEIEFAAINQFFNHSYSKHIAGQAATNQELKAYLPQNYNIFHFTGHGTYNFYNPQNSKLALSGEDFLTLAEILQLENLKQYQLVCLSACETAITSNQTITAEYVGLVSAFLSQGVANVVSTLWTVTDASSAFFMIYFYWKLKKGHSPVVALKKAQKWLRNLTFSKLERIYRVIFAKLPVDEKPLRPFIRRRLAQIEQMDLSQKQTKPFAAPYYWAGFIITGGQN